MGVCRAQYHTQDRETHDQEKFEDIIGVTRSRIYIYQRTDNSMAKRKGAKRQTMLFKTLKRKLRIKQHEPYKNWG